MLFAANNRTGETAFFRAKSSMSGEGRDDAGAAWAMPALGDPRAAPKWLSSNDAGRVQTARYVQQDGLGAAPRVASAGQALWHPDVFDLEASGLCASHAAMHMQGSGSQAAAQPSLHPLPSIGAVETIGGQASASGQPPSLRPSNGAFCAEPRRGVPVEGSTAPRMHMARDTQPFAPVSLPAQSAAAHVGAAASGHIPAMKLRNNVDDAFCAPTCGCTEEPAARRVERAFAFNPFSHVSCFAESTCGHGDHVAGAASSSRSRGGDSSGAAVTDQGSGLPLPNVPNSGSSLQGDLGGLGVSGCRTDSTSAPPRPAMSQGTSEPRMADATTTSDADIRSAPVNVDFARSASDIIANLDTESLHAAREHHFPVGPLWVSEAMLSEKVRLVAGNVDVGGGGWGVANDGHVPVGVRQLHGLRKHICCHHKGSKSSSGLGCLWRMTYEWST